MLDVLCRAVSQLSTAGNLDQPLAFPQLGAELVRRGHDQRLELVDRGGGGADGSMAGGEQDAQGLALATEPRLDQMLGGQGFLCRPDRIAHVGLAPATGSGALGSTDFQDLFTCLIEEGGQTLAVAANAFQAPATTAGDVLAGVVQQPPVVATGVGGDISAGRDAANGAHGRSGEGVTVGVEADDAVDLFCEHGHVVVLLHGRDGRGRRRPGWSHRVAEL